MKSAMQELIDFGWENLDRSPMSIIRKAEKLLEKEKQQIIDAYNNGTQQNSPPMEGSQYYNKTYSQK